MTLRRTLGLPCAPRFDCPLRHIPGGAIGERLIARIARDTCASYSASIFFGRRRGLGVAFVAGPTAPPAEAPAEGVFEMPSDDSEAFAQVPLDLEASRAQLQPHQIAVGEHLHAAWNLRATWRTPGTAFAFASLMRATLPGRKADKRDHRGEHAPGGRTSRPNCWLFRSIWRHVSRRLVPAFPEQIELRRVLELHLLRRA